MLSQISWGSFWKFLFVVVLLYYVFVAVKYYRPQIMSLLKGNKIRGSKDAQPAGRTVKAATKTIKSDIRETNSLFNDAATVSMQIKDTIAVAANEAYDRVRLLDLLKAIIDEHAALNTPAFRIAINNLIMTECDRHGGVDLEREDLEVLWT